MSARSLILAAEKKRARIIKLRSCENGNRTVWHVLLMFRSTILLPSSGCKCKPHSENVTNTLKEYGLLGQPLNH